jgi:ubiquinone/menaquinone biosynthesis C-methylase UbiE
MNSLRELKRNWEGLARKDPFWAICTDPARKDRNWQMEELFATGETEIGRVLGCLAHLGVPVDASAPTLDFGCGVGRLTRAMAARFTECWGVDISATMVEIAQRLNANVPRCHFCLNDKPDLTFFADDFFGFVYTSIVIQHIPPRYSLRYLLEMIRVLKPGGVLVFQVLDQFRGPALARLRQKLALRRRLRQLHFASDGNCLMELHLLRQSRIRQMLSRCAASIIDVRFTNSADPAFNGNLQYLISPPDEGYVSKQYVVVKGAVATAQA